MERQRHNRLKTDEINELTIKRLTIKTMLVATLFGGVMSLFPSCSDKDNLVVPTTDPAADWKKVDQLQVTVTADVPTAVQSQFDETSMGAALVRRLANTTSEIQPNTKMVLIKGEDIMSRPFMEWLAAAKIYLKGGYIVIEKRQKTIKWPERWPEKWPEKACQIIDVIGKNHTITIAELEPLLGLGHTTLKKILREMQNENFIRRVGPDKGGHWEVIEQNKKGGE